VSDIRRIRVSLPFITMVVMAALLFILPTWLGGIVDTLSLYNVLRTSADFGLVALALGLTMIIREFDLSAAAAYALGAVVAVKAGASSALLGAVLAVCVGAGAGLTQGLIIAKFRISSLPVTLGGFIIMAGVTQILSNSRAVPYPDPELGLSLDDRIFEIFAPRSLIVLAIFLVAALLLRYTRAGQAMRAVGGSRRASRTAGVRVDRVVVTVFSVSGALCAAGGLLSAYAVASAPATAGYTPLIFAAIAVLLGGVALSGGEGSPLGILAGVVSLATLQQTLAIVGAPEYVASIVTGGVLCGVSLITAPKLLQAARARALRRQRTAASG
jgi:ribose transport system permease protein